MEEGSVLSRPSSADIGASSRLCLPVRSMAYRGWLVEFWIAASRAPALKNHPKSSATLRVSRSKSLNPYCFILSLSL